MTSTMMRRFIFNGLLFALLLGGVGVFSHLRTGQPQIVDIVVVTVLGSMWAGALVALIEIRIYPLTPGLRRALAALCGGAAYLGLFSGVAVVSGLGTRPEILALGVLIGAVSHLLRASLYGGAPVSDED